MVELSAAYAQTKSAPERQQIVEEVGRNFSQNAVQTFDERYEGVQGTPFLLDQWTLGRVAQRDGKAFTNVQLKYDLYRDEIVVKHPYDHAVIPEKHTVTEFSLRGESDADSLHFILVDYLPNYRKFPPNHFAQVLYGGLQDSKTSTLLAVHEKKLIKADFQGAYSADRRYDEFSEIMTSYYLIKPDGQTDRFKPTTGSVRRLLKDKKGAVSKYLADETVNLEDPHELARLIEHYDQQ